MSFAKGGRPLRVLHVVHDYYPAIGGSELLFQKISEGLLQHGFEVSVFTSNARTTTDFVASNADTLPVLSETINGVAVRRFEMRQFSPHLRRGLDAASQLWSNRRWRGYGMLKSFWVGPHLPGLVDSAVAFAPEIVAATAAPFLPIFRAAQAARRIDCPIAIMPCLHPGDLWMIDNPAVLRLLRTVDGVMALTPYEMRLLRALNVSGDRIWVIGGGVGRTQASAARLDLRGQFGIAGDEPIVLFCGRKDKGKGIQDVLEAMTVLWRQGRRGTLVLAGASTEFSRNELAEKIQQLPSEWKHRVLTRDNIQEDEKWGWYVECDVLAHPSHIEAFGLVYLEAWLCGKPVIGGRTGPQSAVIDEGRDGLLVTPGDVQELSLNIARLLLEPQVASALGKAGRQKVLTRFTWEAVVDRTAEMYRSLTSTYTHAPHQRDRRYSQ